MVWNKFCDLCTNEPTLRAKDKNNNVQICDDCYEEISDYIVKKYGEESRDHFRKVTNENDEHFTRRK